MIILPWQDSAICSFKMLCPPNKVPLPPKLGKWKRNPGPPNKRELAQSSEIALDTMPQNRKNPHYSRNYPNQNGISVSTHWKRCFYLIREGIPWTNPVPALETWTTPKNIEKPKTSFLNSTHSCKIWEPNFVRKFLSEVGIGFEIFLATFSQTHRLIGITASDGVAAVVAITFD